MRPMPNETGPRLTEDEKRTLRILYPVGRWTIYELARAFGVSYLQVRDVVAPDGEPHLASHSSGETDWT